MAEVSLCQREVDLYMSIHKLSKGSQMIFANQALLAHGWASNVRLLVEGGQITSIEEDAAARAGDARVDTLLPALANLHSHSFQRAMAGMAEYRMAGEDSFWTWRDLMYRFTAHLSPEQIEAIAAFVFLEMQEAGYASVGEFHYIHHEPDGTPYACLLYTSPSPRD